MTTRDELHALIDALPEAGLEEARRYLEALREANGDPFLAHLLLAPEDDEPTTPEEDEGAARARAEWERGEYFTAEEIKREMKRSCRRCAPSSPPRPGGTSAAWRLPCSGASSARWIAPSRTNGREMCRN